MTMDLLPVALALLLAPSLQDSARSMSAPALKRELLRRIPDFTDWPQDKLADGQILVIGVVGENPFPQEGPLKDTWQASRFQQVRVVAIRRWSDMDACHVVFLDGAAREPVAAVLGALKGKPVLTVSDLDRAAEQGFMIGLQIHPGQASPTRIQVNLEAARQGGIQLRSRFLKLCQVVKP